MLNLNETNKYNLFTQGVDMRKGIECLCGIVHTYHLNPLNGEVYVFTNKNAPLGTWRLVQRLSEEIITFAHGCFICLVASKQPKRADSSKWNQPFFFRKARFFIGHQ